jgi:arginyl-tRNA synthetase
MITFKNRLKERLFERLKAVFPIGLEDLDMTPTPDPKMGDLALNFPFQLAKKLKKAPRAIAQEAALLLAGVPGVVGAEVAGGGFLNLRLDKATVLAEALRLAGRTDLAPEEGKIVIEHTNINPNKAAHIGHLRNACLGDSLARSLRFKGETVEVQNYIDDTGVQVVDVVFGFMELEKKTVEDLEHLPGKFDYYCWDLYARVSAYLAGHPEAQARKSEITKRIEHGRDPEYGLSRYISRRVVQAHLATMARLGISYDVWKFGLLGRDFYYEPFAAENGRTLWISTSTPSADNPGFGRATKVYNVIDTRQSYLQKVVVQGLRALQYEAQAAKSVHFSYEMVALSPKSLSELGYAASDEEKERSFLEVSGRKGLGVKADDLLDRLEAKALAEIEKRDPDRPAGERRKTARDIATGALRYFMLKFARNSLIIFDFEEALSFEGETGPYLQYTAVRLAGIFRKFKERFGIGEADIVPPAGGAPLIPDGLSDTETADFWDLILTAASLEEEVLRSVSALEFAHLAKFAFLLCQKLNGYYHKYPVLAEDNAGIRSFRLLVLKAAREQLLSALGLMGIPPPDRM